MSSHRQERWKAPLPQFIEELYYKRFGRTAPVTVLPVEERHRRHREKKELRRTARRRRALQNNPGGGRPIGRGERLPSRPRSSVHSVPGRRVGQPHRDDRPAVAVLDRKRRRVDSGSGTRSWGRRSFLATTSPAASQRLWDTRRGRSLNESAMCSAGDGGCGRPRGSDGHSP
jgi:hypothetical protein